MKAYIYQAALICSTCAEEVKRTRPEHDDSDRYPQGPYAEGGGESDCPQHCDLCHVFLENPLTDDGREYVKVTLEAYPANDQLDLWREFYSVGS
jgi:hypothetical protein